MPRAMAQPADAPHDGSVSAPQTVAAGQEPGAGTHPLRADLYGFTSWGSPREERSFPCHQWESTSSGSRST